MTEYIKNTLSGKLRGVTYEDGKIIDVHIRDTDDVVKVFVPVVHGRWIGVDSSYWRWSHDGAHTVEHITFRCSECARKSIIKTNYCPNCGAKMDGGAD